LAVRKKDQELATLKQDAAPLFNVHFESAVIGKIGSSKTPMLTVFLHIINTGAPSIVAGWELEIDRPGLPPLVGVPIVPSKGVNVKVEEGEVKINPSEFLDLKGAEIPIPKNGARAGILSFEFPGLQNSSYADLFPAGSSIELSFDDSIGNRHSSTYLPAGERKFPKTMPGISIQDVSATPSPR
jgi:hypothetical protein